MSYPQIPAYCQPTQRPARSEPVFQVRVMKHVGLLVAWFNQSYTFTGSYAECQRELTRAQQANKAFGWWSIASVLMWNWVALAGNNSARKALARQAAQAFGHPSAYTGPAALHVVPNAS